MRFCGRNCTDYAVICCPPSSAFDRKDRISSDFGTAKPTLCKQSVGFAFYEVSPNYKSAIHVCMLAASVPGRHRSSKTARVFRSRQASAGQKLLRFAQKSRGYALACFPFGETFCLRHILRPASPTSDINEKDLRFQRRSNICRLII